MPAYLLRRLLWGAVVVLTTAVLAYGTIRALRPELYPGAMSFRACRRHKRR